MTSWIIEAIGAEKRKEAALAVGEHLLSDLGLQPGAQTDDYAFTTNAYALAAIDLLGEPEPADELRAAAELAFETLRATDTPEDVEGETLHRLHTACYGILGDRTPDVARYLRAVTLPEKPGAEADWSTQVRGSVYRLWLLLMRKDGWADLDLLLAEVVSLRESQKSAEADFLKAADHPRLEAWRLIAAYHLSKAAEILATYSTHGSVAGGFDVREQLDSQFDRSVVACERAELVTMHATVRLLAATAKRMVANSIWTVTRGAGGRIGRFVQNLVDRARERPIFEMLPPQRITLRDRGLMTSGARSIVVSLPTSGGKTFIAQFRMLQALNQFEAEQGWVAYVAPTRALVNQICARLRRDFAPLGVVVERVSPALDIDGVEAEMLADEDPKSAFRILVGTPEKIDLMLRGGWEAKIGRPLTLVVVDEAHNLSSGARGLKLELLLATINRECRDSQFLLLTPFIQNGNEVARWLSPDSFADVSVQFDWRPNDRAIAIAQPAQAAGRGDFQLNLKTVHTSRATIDIERSVALCDGRELGLTWSQVRNSQSNVAAVAATCLNRRGPIIVVAGTVPNTWPIARSLANDPKLLDKAAERDLNLGARETQDIDFVADFIAEEFGSDFELIDLLRKRIGVHHSGLSDDTRVLMEWLMEKGELDTLVATTTIAQGVNFPVTGVVMQSHQYPYGENMPPEDFWNLAGRAGRADQSGTGIIALAATNDAKAALLTDYVQQNVSYLNSTLIDMVTQALANGPRLELQALYYMKEWSAFLQYLAHSYRQVGDHAQFAAQIEQVLRGSFGFQKLRQQNQAAATQLVAAVQEYAGIIRGKPLAFVDSTGFSWESVSRALAGIRDAGIRADSWNPDTLFTDNDTTLQRTFGVLFRIPELRQELIEVTGGSRGDGDKLARIVKDWVQGATLSDLAAQHFSDEDSTDFTAAISKACKLVFGRLTSTVSWGLSAIQSLTVGDALEGMSDEEKKRFRNLPSRIFYGVNSDMAIDLRLLGVPRSAAQPLADYLKSRKVDGGLGKMRAALSTLSSEDWRTAVGNAGPTYQRAWKVLEGLV
jgi:replicative superfamily II helicase